MYICICIYVDVTTLYAHLEDFSHAFLEDELNINLEKLNRWFRMNTLYLSVDKAKLMIVCARRNNCFRRY